MKRQGNNNYVGEIKRFRNMEELEGNEDMKCRMKTQCLMGDRSKRKEKKKLKKHDKQMEKIELQLQKGNDYWHELYK